jgi:hypothetical protein
MDDEQMQRRAETIEAEGKQRFGEKVWPQLLGALGKRGVDRAALANVMRSPDAVTVLGAAGKEALLDAASNGDAEAERAYGELRNAERKAHALAHGRRWID